MKWQYSPADLSCQESAYKRTNIPNVNLDTDLDFHWGGGLLFRFRLFDHVVLLRAGSGLLTLLSLPKISSAQLMQHVGTHEGRQRVGRVVVCQGWRFGQEPPVARAVAGAGGCSRCPDAAGARCRTPRTPAGRAEGGTGSRSTCGPIARAGRSALCCARTWRVTLTCWSTLGARAHPVPLQNSTRWP